MEDGGYRAIAISLKVLPDSCFIASYVDIYEIILKLWCYSYYKDSS